MNNILSDRLNKLSPSATLAMSQRSSELKAQGVDVINLSVGEPDFNTPDHIKDAAKKAIDENWTRYSPVPGYPDLKKAISDKLKRENNLDYSTDEILTSNGAKQCVCNAVLALVNPGDEVIIPAPYWVSYPQMVKLAEGTPVFVEAKIEADFKITPEQLESVIPVSTHVGEVECQVNCHKRSIEHVQPGHDVRVVQQFVDNAEDITQDDESHEDGAFPDYDFGIGVPENMASVCSSVIVARYCMVSRYCAQFWKTAPLPP